MKPLDVYFCSCPDDEERRQMAKESLDWWKQCSGINLYLLTPERLKCDRREFNRKRRIYADHDSDSYFYIVADDDCIPTTTNWDETLDSILETMAWHPSFAVLSFWPVNANICRWIPEDYYAVENLDVMEHVSVGGIRCCQKLFIKDWPPMEGLGYDLEHADMIRRMGYRVGYFQHHRFTHLGEGHSSLWGKEKICLPSSSS